LRVTDDAILSPSPSGAGQSRGSAAANGAANARGLVLIVRPVEANDRYGSRPRLDVSRARSMTTSYDDVMLFAHVL